MRNWTAGIDWNEITEKINYMYGSDGLWERNWTGMDWEEIMEKLNVDWLERNKEETAL